MMPGVGFVGGALSVVGGYSWPGGVDTVEQWDDDRRQWVKNDVVKLRCMDCSQGNSFIYSTQISPLQSRHCDRSR